MDNTSPRQEFTRVKYEKIKCPYCGATSTLEMENKEYQMRLCKNNHRFSYFKSVEVRNIELRETLANCEISNSLTEYEAPNNTNDSGFDRIRMVYNMGEKKATLI